MSNKYVDKFLLLTEENILTSQAQQHHKDDEAMSKTAKLAVVVVTSFLIYLLTHLHHQEIKISTNMLPHISKPKIIAEGGNVNLVSFIPGFRLAARKQVLHHVSLKKMDLALLDSEDVDNEYEQRMHVMDRVLVVPKMFG